MMLRDDDWCFLFLLALGMIAGAILVLAETIAERPMPVYVLRERERAPQQPVETGEGKEHV